MVIETFIIQDATRVLVLRLQEPVPQLLASCREAGIDVDDLMALPEKRMREKAAERLLLYRAIGHPVPLAHDEQGAPFAVDCDVNISITHTPQLVALAINEHQVIGLDAERADRQQVLRVRTKFLNAREQQFITPEDLPAHIVAWTAKEAVIKAERNSAIDWTEGICLEPFSLPASLSEGISLTVRCGEHCYDVTVRPVEGHFLTLAVPAR